MAKMYPEKLDIDTRLLDVFTEAAEKLLIAHEKGLVTGPDFISGISDLITLTKKVPRSVTITVGDENAG